MEILKEIIVATDRANLFLHWIEPVLLESWFCSECECKVGLIIRPGVKFRLWFLLGNREYSFVGHYIEVVNFEKIVFERTQNSKSTVVAIRFEYLNDNETKIFVSEFGPRPKQLKRQERFWDFYLTNLKNVIEGGFDERHKVLGQIVKESSGMPVSSRKSFKSVFNYSD